MLHSKTSRRQLPRNHSGRSLALTSVGIVGSEVPREELCLASGTLGSEAWPCELTVEVDQGILQGWFTQELPA